MLDILTRVRSEARTVVILNDFSDSILSNFLYRLSLVPVSNFFLLALMSRSFKNHLVTGFCGFTSTSGHRSQVTSRGKWNRRSHGTEHCDRPRGAVLYFRAYYLFNWGAEQQIITPTSPFLYSNSPFLFRQPTFRKRLCILIFGQKSNRRQ